LGDFSALINTRSFLFGVQYYIRIAPGTAKLFGLGKTVRFLFHLPLTLFAGTYATEGAASRANSVLGGCDTEVFGRVVHWTHVDVPNMHEIIIRRCYNPNRCFAIGPNAIVIDAGANIGIFTILAAIQATRGKIYAVEPEKRNFKFLNDNLKANNLANVLTINAALADKRGTTSLFLASNPPSHSIIRSRDGTKGIQACETTTIADLICQYSLDRVDFLKMDIEGAEFLVFKNPSWLNKVERLVVEVHLSYGDVVKMIKTLEAAGFKVATSRGYAPGLVLLYACRSEISDE
jgi:FkbM family methyltransferase